MVVVCLDCDVQGRRGHPVTVAQRHDETRAGLAILGARPIFLGVPESMPLENMRAAVIERLQRMALAGVTHVWAPASAEHGHPQHNIVASAADFLWGCSDATLTRYLTYTRDGKQTGPRRVEIEDGEWVARKLNAIACHRSQMDPALGCVDHFLGGLEEFYEN